MGEIFSFCQSISLGSYPIGFFYYHITHSQTSDERMNLMDNLYPITISILARRILELFELEHADSLAQTSNVVISGEDKGAYEGRKGDVVD